MAAMGLSFSLAQAATPQAGIQVSGGWARATPPQAATAAGYLTLVNAGAQPDRLVAVASPLAARVELHASAMAGGMMRMRKVQALDLPAGVTVALAPSGTHLMFIAPRQPLVAGQEIEVTLTFAHAPAQVVHLKVLPLGAAPAADSMHGMRM